MDDLNFKVPYTNGQRAGKILKKYRYWFLLIVPLLFLTAFSVYIKSNQLNTKSKADTGFIPPPVNTGIWWQLGGTVPDNPMFEVVDIDGFEKPASKYAALKANGKYTIAYFSAGSFENWRPDVDKFPASVKGNNLVGWEGERWLDVRQISILQPIMEARADIAKSKGADAIEWDNIDGFENNPGFPITRAQQLTYNRMLAEITHARGMAVIQKNGADMVDDLLPYFDAILVEEAYRWGDVPDYMDYKNAGKASWFVEYRLQDYNSADAIARGIFLALYPLDLDSPPLQWTPVDNNTPMPTTSATTVPTSPLPTTVPTNIVPTAIPTSVPIPPTVIPTTNPTLFPKISLLYEAEAATLYRALVANRYPGYTGAGYVDYQNNYNDYIEWVTNIPLTGTYKLKFRYANNRDNRPLQIKVNGVTVKASLSFPYTGSWRTWRYVELPLNLNAGVNKIKATAIGKNGANIDHLSITNY